ncbi:MAG TPA: hypothetical protein VFC18_22190 [Burkholderiales bacterium]|nr:hypothetical protein [Burkholderiales bacterium]
MHDPDTRIRHQTVANLMKYRGAPEAQINRRLKELDREWDIERTLELNAATLALAGFAAGAFNRRFLLIPAAVCGLLLQHAVRGTSPPVRLLRRLGFRKPREIEAERLALTRMTPHK